MKKLVEEFDEFFECNPTTDHLFEMSNLRPRRTGLPMIIWLLIKTGKEKHGPRIKVQTIHGRKAKPEKMVSVSISSKPEIKAGKGLSNQDFKLVSNFIKRFKDDLLKFWNDEIDMEDLLEILKKEIKNA